MPDLDPLVAALRRRRQNMAMTQQQLADRAGIGLRTLADTEQGRRGTTLSTLRLWTRALGVELALREPS